MRDELMPQLEQYDVFVTTMYLRILDCFRLVLGSPCLRLQLNCWANVFDPYCTIRFHSSFLLCTVGNLREWLRTFWLTVFDRRSRARGFDQI